jgi:hypothetical protein
MRPASADETTATGTKSTAGEELGRLVGKAGAALNLQCRAAHQELEQTQLLLADATRKLLDSFQCQSRIAGWVQMNRDASQAESACRLPASSSPTWSDN